MKLDEFIETFLLQPLREFFLRYLRFSPVRPHELKLFVLGCTMLLAFMLGSSYYLINLLGALCLLPMLGLISAIETLKLQQTGTGSASVLFQPLLESLLYLGLILHYANLGNALFASFAALSLLSIWLMLTLKEQLDVLITLPKLELRLLFLAIATALNLSFIYLVVLILGICAQILWHYRTFFKQ